MSILATVPILRSQTAADAAVQLSVSTQPNPPEITLHWTTNATSTGYQVYRKLKSASAWGPLLVNLTGSATQYVDNSVSPGLSYEYRVFRSGTNYSANGYVNCGIEVPETEFRGRLILLTDSVFIAPLATEIDRLTEDIESDGWEVKRIAVDRNGSVQHVHSLIQAEYNNDPTNTKAVFLLGHIPVPYSGNLNPDAHPDHLGAWPADVFYGDMNGSWTDQIVSSTTASPPRTQNVPGDGKFDQSAVPGDVELQVGRVDLSSMTTFSVIGTEEQLLKNYLDRDHEYRKKIWVPQKRAVIDDNFGYFSGEAFASGGYRNFSPLVGPGNITAADYVSSLNAGSYLWSYGCGGGSFTSAGGIGNSAAIAGSTLQGVFTMLFGSYFGDWDVPNNFLRAPLASGRVLANVWSGRPHYHFHHMGLGENIGYSLLMTQNYSGTLYYASPFGITGKWVHNALMGDPTLRNDVVAPVSNVVATRTGFHCQVSWSPSPDPMVLGYHIYMRNDSNAQYTRINSLPVTDTMYTDSCLWYAGVNKYMVRALKLEQTPSGSFYNLSEGISDTAFNNLDPSVAASFSLMQSANSVSLVNTSTGNGAFLWDSGDGQQSSDTNFVVTYPNNGVYQVILVVSNECDRDTAIAMVSVTGVDLSEFSNSTTLRVFPNPTTGSIAIMSPLNGKVTIRNLAGEFLFIKEKNSPTYTMNLHDLPPGFYLLEIRATSGSAVGKIIKN